MRRIITIICSLLLTLIYLIPSIGAAENSVVSDENNKTRFYLSTDQNIISEQTADLFAIVEKSTEQKITSAALYIWSENQDESAAAYFSEGYSTFDNYDYVNSFRVRFRVNDYDEVNYKIYPGVSYLYKMQCMIDNETYTTEIGSFISKGVHSHNFLEIDGTPATCTEDGCIRRECQFCHLITSTPVYAVGHSFGEWSAKTPADCMIDGASERKCSICGATETKTIAAAENHTFDDWIVINEPTCTKNGKMTRACSVCQKSETAIIQSTGHSYGIQVYTKKPTCTEKGSATRTCSVCGDIETQSIPVLGHSYSEWTMTVQPTCTSKGTETKTCSLCGDIEAQSVPALGHFYSEWTMTVQPTCTSKGTETKTCSLCGDIEAQSVPALGHSYSEQQVITAPTCTKNGTAVSTCSICKMVSTISIAATGHSFSEWQKTSEMNYVRSCVICGFTETKIIPTEEISSEIQKDNRKLGDINYDNMITSADARQILRISANLENVSAEQKIIADVNADNQITAADARIVLRISAKLN